MTTLLTYRDDGPLAKRFGRPNPLAPSLLTLVALVPLAVAIGAGEHSKGVAAAVLAWFVALGGLAGGGPLERDRLNWAVPPLLRAGEYAALIWLWPPAALAVLIPLAFRHYDVVYALRYRGGPPTAPTGGWDGRLVLAWILLAADALPEGFYALGGILGVLFVAECVASWLNHDSEGNASE
jgi:hypothetical protein